MCRLVGFRINDYSLLRVFSTILASISRYDPLLPTTSPGGHDDGWGMAIHDRGSNNVVFYKTSEPFYANMLFYESIVKNLRCTCKGVVHIRKASPGEPLGLVYAHPFVAEVKGFVALAHNGGVDKNVLANLLGLNTSIVEEFSDTYLYFQLFLRKLSNKSVVDAITSTIRELLELNAVRTSINSIILYVGREDRSRVYVVEDWQHFDGSKREYYRIGYAIKDDNIVAASSTVYYRLLDLGFREYKPKPIYELEVKEHRVKIIEL